MQPTEISVWFYQGGSGSQPFGGRMTLSQRLHARYPAYQISTLWFLTVVKLQLWRNNKINWGSPQHEELDYRATASGRLRAAVLGGKKGNGCIIGMPRWSRNKTVIFCNRMLTERIPAKPRETAAYSSYLEMSAIISKNQTRVWKMLLQGRNWKSKWGWIWPPQ